MAYFVYWIVSGRLSYIGATVAPHRRLRQHNGELAGGARRTRSRTDWRFKCIVSGFRTRQEALQFEWAFKYHSRRCRGVESRALAPTALMERERWTANAPLASDVPLRVEYDPCVGTAGCRGSSGAACGGTRGCSARGCSARQSAWSRWTEERVEENASRSELLTARLALRVLEGNRISHRGQGDGGGPVDLRGLDGSLPHARRRRLRHALARALRTHSVSHVRARVHIGEPLAWRNIYGPREHAQYMHAPRGAASGALVLRCRTRSTRTERGSQTLVVTGESGAGKTEVARLSLQYLSHACDASSQSSVLWRTLRANHSMEFIGNAETQHNGNSSRFGKLLSVRYARDGAPLGARVTTHLLERCRVVALEVPDGAFRIFYAVLDDAQSNDEFALHAIPRILLGRVDAAVPSLWSTLGALCDALRLDPSVARMVQHTVVGILSLNLRDFAHMASILDTEKNEAYTVVNRRMIVGNEVIWTACDLDEIKARCRAGDAPVPADVRCGGRGAQRPPGDGGGAGGRALQCARHVWLRVHDRDGQWSRPAVHQLRKRTPAQAFPGRGRCLSRAALT